MTLTPQDIAIIENMLKSAVIISPRFTDYRVQEVLVKPPSSPSEDVEIESSDSSFGSSSLGVGDIGTALAASRGGNITALLSRFGAAAGIASPIAIAFLIQPVTEQVILELQRPGGFFDKRVRIDAQEEIFAGLDRQTRQNTRIGDRQVIIQQFSGFRNFEGHASTNTSVLIRENADRVLDIGLLDRAQGMSLGGR